MRLMLGIALALAVGRTVVAQRTPSLREMERQAAQDSLIPEAHYRLAAGYLKAKRPGDAGRELSLAIAIDSRYSPAYVALAFLPYQERSQLAKEVRKHAVPPEWRDSLAVSRRLLRQGFLIDPLVDLLPPDVDPREAAFGTLMLHSWLEREYRGKARAEIPLGALWLRGMLSGREGRYGPAIDDFEFLLHRAQQIEEDSIVPFTIATNDFRYILAVLYERNARPADAIAAYRETLTNDLGHYMAHVRLAKLYRQYHMWDEAVEESRRAVEVNPDDPAAVRELGEALLGAGRLADAEAALREARQRNPRDMGTEYVLGVVNEQEGRPAEARINYERFLALAPAELYANQIADARRRLAALPDSAAPRR